MHRRKTPDISTSYPDVTTGNRSKRWQRVAAFALVSSLGPLSGCVSQSEITAASESNRAIVTSWNVLFDPNGEENPDTQSAIEAKADDIVAGVQQLTNKAPGQVGATVVMLQEVTKSKYREQLKKDIVDCETCMHDVFFAETNHGSELPIFWNETIWKLENRDKDTGRILATPKQANLNDGGSGGSEINDRYIVYVDLTHIASGEKVRFANTHVIPDNKLPTREKLFERHMKVMREFVADCAEEDINLVMGFDGNRNLRDRDNQQLFEDMGLELNWVEKGFPEKGGTHNPDNDAVIDALASRGDVTVTYTKKHVDANESDHRSVIGVYRLGEIAADFAN